MLKARKSNRYSSSPYAASNSAASRLGRGPRRQTQPKPALSTSEAPVKPVEMLVPNVTNPIPASQQIPAPVTSGTVFPASSMLSSAIAKKNPTALIKVSDNLCIYVPKSFKEKNWSKDNVDLAKLLHSDLDTDKPDHIFF